MLTRWLLKLADVQHTQDPEVIEEIGRFRYNIYVNEFNFAAHPTADHERGVILDDNDFDENVHHFYTGTRAEMMSVFKFQGIQGRDRASGFSSEIFGRPIPRLGGPEYCGGKPDDDPKDSEGQALYASMVYQGFEFLAEKHQTDLVFLYCLTWLSPSLPSARLSSLWRRGGWRAADGPLGHRDVGCRALQKRPVQS